MCFVETFRNDDGTFSAVCYCGWSDHGHTTAESADAAAAAHQNRTDTDDLGDGAEQPHAGGASPARNA